MYLDWKVGDRVVCLDDTPSCEGPFPVKGKVYTIRRIDFWRHWIAAVPGVGVWLCEITRPLDANGREHPYGAYRFRKVQPRKTSIAIFEAMLHGNRSEVDA